MRTLLLPLLALSVLAAAPQDAPPGSIVRPGRIQSTQTSEPVKADYMNGQFMVTHPELPTASDELKAAERYLRDAIKYGAPVEAQLRLGRVIGRLGRHTDAAAMLAQAAPAAGEARLAYLHQLFLGTEFGAIGRIEEGRACLERAAGLFPTAQAPLLAMSDLFRRSGNRSGALDAVLRLERLPSKVSARIDLPRISRSSTTGCRNESTTRPLKRSP